MLEGKSVLQQLVGFFTLLLRCDSENSHTFIKIRPWYYYNGTFCLLSCCFCCCFDLWSSVFKYSSLGTSHHSQYM